MTRVHVEIDELVLTGFDHRDRFRIASAMELELVSLIKEKRLPTGLAKGRTTHQVDAPSFNAPADSNPRTIGIETARSIYKGLGRHRDGR
jgi:hypothetical protein